MDDNDVGYNDNEDDDDIGGEAEEEEGHEEEGLLSHLISNLCCLVFVGPPSASRYQQ